MLKMKMQKQNRCLIWHRWKLKRDSGVYRYHECKDCGARIVNQYNDRLHQPANLEWVTGLSNDL